MYNFNRFNDFYFISFTRNQMAQECMKRQIRRVDVG